MWGLDERGREYSLSLFLFFLLLFILKETKINSLFHVLILKKLIEQYSSFSFLLYIHIARKIKEIFLVFWLNKVKRKKLKIKVKNKNSNNN